MRPPRREVLHVRAVLATLAVAGLVAVVAYAAGSGSPLTSSKLPLVQVTAPTSASPSPLATPGPSAPVSPLVVGVIAAVAVLAVGIPVLYALVRFLLLLLGVRRREDLLPSSWDDDDIELAGGDVVDDPARAERLLAGVEAGLGRLDAAGDPRTAVIECWVRLELAAGDVGVRRRPEETATDLAVRVLREQRVRRSPLDRLLLLYHEARYSPHAIGPGDRDAARAVLDELRTDLAGRGVRA